MNTGTPVEIVDTRLRNTTVEEVVIMVITAMMKIITCDAKSFVVVRAAKTPTTSDIWQKVLLLVLV
jgi:hypothetical protein